MTKINDTLANRLAKQSVVTERGCVEWTGDRTDRGYGRISINYKTKRVHRVSYELHFGPIPDELCVLHRCDNPPCFNPEHLFLGTNKDNTQDMLRKGRRRPQRWGNKLTAEQVVKIRADTRNGRIVGEEYHISTQVVSKVRLRQIWKWVP